MGGLFILLGLALLFTAVWSLTNKEIALVDEPDDKKPFANWNGRLFSKEEEEPENLVYLEDHFAELSTHFGWDRPEPFARRIVGRIKETQITLIRIPESESPTGSMAWQLCFDSERLARFELLGLPSLEMKVELEEQQKLIDRAVVWTLLNHKAKRLLQQMSEPASQLCYIGPLLLLRYEADKQSKDFWIRSINQGLELIEQLWLSLQEGSVSRALLENVQKSDKPQIQRRSLELLLQHSPSAEEAQWAIRIALARSETGSLDHQSTLRLILQAFTEAFSEEWCPPEVYLTAMKSHDQELQLLGAIAAKDHGNPRLKKIALSPKFSLDHRKQAVDVLVRTSQNNPKDIMPTLVTLSGSEELDIRRHILRHVLDLRAAARNKRWPTFDLLHQESLQLLSIAPVQTLLEITDWLRQYALADEDVYDHNPPLLDNLLYLLFRTASPERIIRLSGIFESLQEASAEPVILAWLQYEKIHWRDKEQEYRAKCAMLEALSECGTVDSLDPLNTALANNLLPPSLHAMARGTSAHILDRISTQLSGTFPSMEEDLDPSATDLDIWRPLSSQKGALSAVRTLSLEDL